MSNFKEQKPVLSPPYEAIPGEPSGYDPNQQKAIRQFYTMRAGNNACETHMIHLGFLLIFPGPLVTVDRHMHYTEKGMTIKCPDHTEGVFWKGIFFT